MSPSEFDPWPSGRRQSVDPREPRADGNARWPRGESSGSLCLATNPASARRSDQLPAQRSNRMAIFSRSNVSGRQSSSHVRRPSGSSSPASSSTRSQRGRDGKRVVELSPASEPVYTDHQFEAATRRNHSRHRGCSRDRDRRGDPLGQAGHQEHPRPGRSRGRPPRCGRQPRLERSPDFRPHADGRSRGAHAPSIRAVGARGGRRTGPDSSPRSAQELEAT